MLINKETLVKHIKKKEDYQVVMKALDKAESVLKNHRILCTDFYDPYQITICSHVLNNILDVRFAIVGGHEGAERQVMIIYPEYMSMEEIDSPIGALKITGKFNKDDLSHRDFLGSILGLGLKREKTGDILVSDGQANVIAFREICEYIRLNLEKVARYKVDVENISFDEMIKNELEYKLIHTTVAALRLDTVLAAGFGESRSSISKLINNDRVKVNWKVVNEPAYTLSEGDVISFRGKGRIFLESIGGKSKKDRYKVVIKRII